MAVKSFKVGDAVEHEGKAGTVEAVHSGHVHDVEIELDEGGTVRTSSEEVKKA